MVRGGARRRAKATTITTHDPPTTADAANATTDATTNAITPTTTLVSLLIHAGDLSYADCEQPRWDSYAQMIEPLASTVVGRGVAGGGGVASD